MAGLFGAIAHDLGQSVPNTFHRTAGNAYEAVAGKNGVLTGKGLKSVAKTAAGLLGVLNFIPTVAGLATAGLINGTYNKISGKGGFREGATQPTKRAVNHVKDGISGTGEATGQLVKGTAKAVGGVLTAPLDIAFGVTRSSIAIQPDYNKGVQHTDYVAAPAPSSPSQDHSPAPIGSATGGAVAGAAAINAVDSTKAEREAKKDAEKAEKEVKDAEKKAEAEKKKKESEMNKLKKEFEKDKDSDLEKLYKSLEKQIGKIERVRGGIETNFTTPGSADHYIDDVVGITTPSKYRDEFKAKLDETKEIISEGIPGLFKGESGSRFSSKNTIKKVDKIKKDRFIKNLKGHREDMKDIIDEYDDKKTTPGFNEKKSSKEIQKFMGSLVNLIEQIDNEGKDIHNTSFDDYYA